MVSKTPGKRPVVSPGIRLIQELLLNAKTKEDMQEVLEFIKELSDKEDLEE